MLFGCPVDRFFMDLQNPPEELEMVVTEELYAVALQSRMCGGEPRDYEHFEYREQESEEPVAMGTPEYTEGMRSGNKGESAIRCPYKLGSFFRAEWMAGHTLGTRLFRESRVTEAVCETPLMRRGSDCRVIRGKAEY